MIRITLKQAKELVKAFGGDKETIITVESGDGHSGKGLYLSYTDHEDEGAVHLGEEQ